MISRCTLFSSMCSNSPLGVSAPFNNNNYIYFLECCLFLEVFCFCFCLIVLFVNNSMVPDWNRSQMDQASGGFFNH